MNVLTHVNSTVYSCMVLILPTESFHFRGFIAYTFGDVTRVLVLSPLPSGRNPFYGFCDPEGSICTRQPPTLADSARHVLFNYTLYIEF